MDRRGASRALAAAAITGTALLDPLEGWLQPAAVSSQARRIGKLGERDMEQLEQTAQLFRRWDHTHGGGLRRKAVLGQLAEIAAALDEHQTDAVEFRLYRVMAHLSGTAATMAWDSGFQRQAQDYYRLALRSAHAGDDVMFGANVLAGMARQMLYRRQPQDALSDAGQKDEPYWIAYFDQAELAGVTGGRLLDLARQDPSHSERAMEHIRYALSQRGPEASRSHALDRIGLAECHFLSGDMTEAARETHLAVDTAWRTASARVRNRLGELYSYTVGQSTTWAVRDVRDRVRDLLANR